MKIVLPWPDPRLFPNWKRAHHWAKYHGVAKNARSTACLLTRSAMARAKRSKAEFAGDGPMPIRVSFYPPDLRKRDDDGVIGAIKHHRDGVADALAVDDARFKPEYIFEAVDRINPRVEFEV